MANSKEILLFAENTLLEALAAIDRTGFEIALVVDQDNVLLGTITDGDIRRAILKGKGLDERVAQVMNRSPKSVFLSDSDDEILFSMAQNSIKAIPVLDQSGKVVGLKLLKELIRRKPRENFAVIMAGGKGIRLGEITSDVPKPLLNVGGRPLIATILLLLRNHGFRNIFISVNHQATKIVDFIKDGSQYDVNVEYLKEKEFLGTAGSLSLLPKNVISTVLVVNGDILSQQQRVNSY
ncbi:MAG: CBS domain-containing protein [Candidatus Riflebacteria bacterium]|nr:CBS domain-containing protein [Candidatus Riflebacteria bacterium]